MKKFVSFFRATISFIEKFVQHFIGFTKSNYKVMKKFHSFLVGLHVTPTKLHTYGYAFLVTIIGVVFLIPIAAWSGIKSV